MLNAAGVEVLFDVESVTISWPSLLIATVSTLLVCFLFALWWQHPRYGRNKGPQLFPFVGCLPQMLVNVNRLYDWASDEILKTPTMTIRAPVAAWELIRTANPANVEHILRTKFENYPNGQWYGTFFSDFTGAGGLSADGSAWKLQRKFQSPYFGTHMVRGLALSSVQEGLADRFIPVLESFCDNKTVVDLQDLLMLFAFDALCQIAFGINPGCLMNSHRVSSVPFATAFDDAVLICYSRIWTLPPWWMQKFFNIGSERKLRQSLLTVDTFLFNTIKTRRKELADGHCKDNSDVLSLCIQLADELVESPEMKQHLEQDPRSKSASVQASDLFLRDFMVGALLAGKDTSSSGLSWFFWLLSSNPKVEAKICDEIQATLSSRRHEHHPTTLFSFEELKGMHYLHASLTESMRLYPPAPQIAKEAAANDVLPDGTAIAKGTIVLLQLHAMGRSESIWGTDCLAFRPERFLQDGKFVPPSPFSYPIFSAGPRMCQGVDMGMMVMKLIAATLLHRYVFVVGEGHHAMGVLSLTMKIEEGLPVYVRRREG